MGEEVLYNIVFTENYIVPQVFIDYSQTNFQLSRDMMKKNILIKFFNFTGK